MSPQRSSTPTEQLVIDVQAPCRRQLGQKLRQIVALREAVADEQDLDRLWPLSLSH
jgi:hypothetical protein